MPASSQLQQNSEPRKKLYVLAFWIVVILPWILDYFGRRAVFMSVFGASAWGLAVGLSVAQIRTKDLRFKRSLGLALIGVSAVWLLYWVVSFFEVQNTVQDLSALPRWLMLTHAGLLAAGAGMVLLNLIVSLTWLRQNRLLHKSSWERRTLRWTPPSLEALGKVSSGAIDLALASWGLGFFLAIVNGILKWSRAGSALGWFKDPKVIFTALLWLLLAIVFQLGHVISKTNRKLFVAYAVLSFIFLLGFFCLMFFGRVSELHEPINWFVQ